jgi:hypothetical protein
MDLTQRFKNAASGILVLISSLEVDRRYLVLRAERIVTKYGPTILLIEIDINTVKHATVRMKTGTAAGP